MYSPSSRLHTNVARQRRHSSQLMQIDSGSHTCKTTCRENFKRYLQNTTLHGLKYLGDDTTTVFER